MEQADFEAMVGRLGVSDRPEPDDDRLLERGPDARAVLEQLPPVYRQLKAAELLAFVREPELVRAAKHWLPEQGNLLLVGPTRAGKTTAAAYLFRRLLSAGVRGDDEAWYRAKHMRWFAAEALERAKREHPLGRGEVPDITAACHARVLVIDDAGWDRDPSAVSQVLHDRYESGWPTVITTGRSRPELVSHYGEAVVRRMLESRRGRAVVVETHREKTS